MNSPRVRVPSNYYVYADAPDEKGQEALHFISPTRRVKLRGRAFREFLRFVVPLLDGTRTANQVTEAVREVFAPADLEECFKLLGEHGLLENVESWGLSDAAQEKLRPQLNFFQMLSPEPWVLSRRLAEASAAVLGLSGLGAATALSLAACGAGHIRCIDPQPVQAADLYSCGVYAHSMLGRSRAEAISERIASTNPEVQSELFEEPLTDDAVVERALNDCQFVVNCLDEGNISTIYKLNRVALRRKIPWTTAFAAGLEIVLGPTVFPGETACYMCYRMRGVACAPNPQSEFDFQAHLDRRKTDDSGAQANLVFGTTLAAQLAGLEAFKTLSGALSPSLKGRILVLDLRDLTVSMHVLLRKPWCPACFSSWDEGAPS